MTAAVPIRDRHSASRRASLLADPPPRPAIELADEPRGDEADRFAIYVVTERNRWRLAETSLAGIGLALQTLREEEQITNDSRVGVLDRLDRTWLINPWAKGGV